MSRPENKAAHEALEAWRERYMTDASVTHLEIARNVGFSQSHVCSVFRKNGWVRSEEMTIEARNIAAHETKMRNIARRPVLTDADIFRAAPSIWAAAAGRAVTTSRPHKEVSHV